MEDLVDNFTVKKTYKIFTSMYLKNSALWDVMSVATVLSPRKFNLRYRQLCLLSHWSVKLIQEKQTVLCACSAIFYPKQAGRRVLS